MWINSLFLKKRIIKIWTTHFKISSSWWWWWSTYPNASKYLGKNRSLRGFVYIATAGIIPYNQDNSSYTHQYSWNSKCQWITSIISKAIDIFPEIVKTIFLSPDCYLLVVSTLIQKINAEGVIFFKNDTF